MDREESERTLIGGPLNGETHTWTVGRRLEIAVRCPEGPDLDRALYDPEGIYLHSQHGSEQRIESCGQCSLCPGHVVEIIPGEIYNYDELGLANGPV